MKDEKHNLLVLNASVFKDDLSLLKENFNVYQLSTFDSCKSLIEAILVGRGSESLSESQIQILKNNSLKVVGFNGASLKKFKVEPYLIQNVPLLNASDSYAETVAEFVVMQMILGHRKALLSHETMRSGFWGFAPKDYSIFKNLVIYFRKNFNIPIFKNWYKKIKNVDLVKHVLEEKTINIAHNFAGSTICLIGFGEITKKVCEYLRPFNCKIFVVSEYLSSEDEVQYGVKKAKLLEILPFADIVSVHRGLSERTKNSITLKELNFLKQNAVLVNTSRGEIVNESDLIAFLKQRKDVFACLDVFTQEPLDSKSQLRALPNVFLTSHISGSTNEMYQRAGRNLIYKIKDYLDSGQSKYLIDGFNKFNNMS